MINNPEIKPESVKRNSKIQQFFNKKGCATKGCATISGSVAVNAVALAVLGIAVGSFLALLIKPLLLKNVMVDLMKLPLEKRGLLISKITLMALDILAILTVVGFGITESAYCCRVIKRRMIKGDSLPNEEEEEKVKEKDQQKDQQKKESVPKALKVNDDKKSSDSFEQSLLKPKY
ncbi:MAG: hypothetical protein AMS24_02010 [Chlamydiae bacterium SM23_39]|nr:MAG: hypothetical protein AMS24_02010 [Chlamydiae bacterium SM23_39]